MTTLTRFNPFRNPARIDAPVLFDELFRGFPTPALWRDAGAYAPDMPVDVTEDEKAYRVKAEIPGVNKEDIEVAVEGNRVSISAESKKEVEKKDEKEIIVERTFGKAYRSFSLPADIDNDHTEARYEKGVLLLTLPKKENGGTRRIAVS